MEDNKKIVKFNGKAGEYYQVWLARNEAALHAKKAMSVVDVDVLSTACMSLSSEVKEKIADARAIIVHGLSDKPLCLWFPDLHNPHKMWIHLRERYAVTNLATKVQLQTKLARLSYCNQPMPVYIAEFEHIYNRLAGMQLQMDEEMQVASFLASSDDRSISPYDHVITNLHSQVGTTQWDQVTARLLQEYEDKVWASDNPKAAKRIAAPAAALHVNRGAQQRGGLTTVPSRFVATPAMSSDTFHEL